jgi:excisionase family DNA binding protein
MAERPEKTVKRLVCGINDAAIMLDVSRDTIERMLAGGDLPFASIRGQRKIPLKAIYEKCGLEEDN